MISCFSLIDQDLRFGLNPKPRLNYVFSLQQLTDWVVEQEGWANEEAVRLSAPYDPFIPEIPEELPVTESQFLRLNIPGVYAALDFLRIIRHKFDDVVRNYESDELWDSERVRESSRFLPAEISFTFTNASRLFN